MKNSARSGSLFHYTREFDFLKSILKNGFYPRYCLEHTSLFFQSPTKSAFPMVCFCDIPLSRSSRHTGDFGEYGIGVKKEWAIRNKANPVIYLSQESTILNDFRVLIGQDEDSFEVAHASYGLLGHTKPLSVSGTGGELEEFHQECEWRYVPEIRRDHINSFLKEEAFNDEKLIEENQALLAQHYSVAIQATEITSIIVKTDSEIEEAIDFLKGLENFTKSEIDLLLTRISSFESINRDY